MTTESLSNPEVPNDFARIPGHLFTPAGKWKYDVDLDYTGLDLGHYDLPKLVEQALANATARGTSGVNISEIPAFWRLVVIALPGPFSHPIMLQGDRHDQDTTATPTPVSLAVAA